MKLFSVMPFLSIHFNCSISHIFFSGGEQKKLLLHDAKSHKLELENFVRPKYYATFWIARNVKIYTHIYKKCLHHEIHFAFKRERTKKSLSILLLPFAHSPKQQAETVMDFEAAVKSSKFLLNTIKNARSKYKPKKLPPINDHLCSRWKIIKLMRVCRSSPHVEIFPSQNVVCYLRAKKKRFVHIFWALDSKEHKFEGGIKKTHIMEGTERDNDDRKSLSEENRIRKGFSQ